MTNKNKAVSTGARLPCEKPLRHWLHSLKNALAKVRHPEGWLDEIGEVGKALRAWRSELVADLGGEEAVSAQQRVVIDLAAKTYLLLQSVDRYLLQQPSLVHRRERRLYQVVTQRQQLADALARYMMQLGLERRARPDSLQEYLSRRGNREEGSGAVDSQSVTLRPGLPAACR